MTWLFRAAWLLSAVLAAAVAATILHVHYTGLLPFALLAAIALVCAVRPAWGLPLVAGLVPIAWYSASKLWNPKVAWAEALVLAALAGLGVDAARGTRRLPIALAAPAAILGAVVAASLAAGIDVYAVRQGPDVWRQLFETISDEYFVDHSLLAVHAGLLLLEGLLLFAHAARLAARPGMLRAVSAATAMGSAAAAACTLLKLGQSAARAPSFVTALVDLAGRLRWNVHYEDVNAAGSVFAMTLLLACGVAWTSPRRARAVWIAAAILIAAGLWLTSSRIAVIAVPAALAAALLLPRALSGRRQAMTAAAVAAGVCALLAAVALILPQRGIQKSSLVAADVRLGLIQTGTRMIRAYPAFGIGLGEFHERSGDFTTPELLAKFPVAGHENAHNNYIQIAAETGIAGGLAFAWIVAAVLAVTAWRAASTHDRLLQFVFAGVAAYALTMAAGHPLLVPEAAYAFWLMAGAAGGAAIGERDAVPRPMRTTILIAASLAVVAATLPLRLSAAVKDADLDHLGIGVSQWRMSPDGIRCREAVGTATLYVPPGAFKLSINPRASSAVRLEVIVDGRVADVRLLEPNRWNDLVVAARTVQADARFRRMDLRTIEDAHTVLWLTKDEPILPH